MGWLGRLLCRWGYHDPTYRRLNGCRGFHMACSRCADTTYADPYGLAFECDPDWREMN